MKKKQQQNIQQMHTASKRKKQSVKVYRVTVADFGLHLNVQNVLYIWRCTVDQTPLIRDTLTRQTQVSHITFITAPSWCVCSWVPSCCSLLWPSSLLLSVPPVLHFLWQHTKCCSFTVAVKILTIWNRVDRAPFSRHSKCEGYEWQSYRANKKTHITKSRH